MESLCFVLEQDLLYPQLITGSTWKTHPDMTDFFDWDVNNQMKKTTTTKKNTEDFKMPSYMG